MSGFLERLETRLASLPPEARRLRRPLEGAQGAWAWQDGRRLLNFSSNDYLGLASHPAVVGAAARALRQYGVGSGGSQLVCGYSRAQQALEEQLAELTGRERCLVFSSGYLANLAVVGALLGPGALACADRLSHASLVDAILLSRARLSRYRHADPESLRRKLAAAAGRDCLAITEGVFSMEGDVPPLREIARLCRRRGVALMVDDAHGVGVLGATGAGTLQDLGLGQEQVPVLVGTFGKALGCAGAFVAGAAGLVETLVQRARPLIYTTALPPALMQAAGAALLLLRREGWRRRRLHERIQYFLLCARQLGLPLLPSRTPIQPLPVGASREAVRLSRALLENGMLVPAVRAPTVPRGEARLRISLTTCHERGHIDALLESLGKLCVRGSAQEAAGASGGTSVSASAPPAASSRGRPS